MKHGYFVPPSCWPSSIEITFKLLLLVQPWLVYFFILLKTRARLSQHSFKCTKWPTVIDACWLPWWTALSFFFDEFINSLLLSFFYILLNLLINPGTSEQQTRFSVYSNFVLGYVFLLSVSLLVYGGKTYRISLWYLLHFIFSFLLQFLSLPIACYESLFQIIILIH